MCEPKIWYFKYDSNLKIMRLDYFNIKNIYINKKFNK